jgi:hypothetical protein
MGGKSLMKIYSLLLMGLVASSMLKAEATMEQIDNMIKKIQEKRVSKIEVDFDKVKNAYIVIAPSADKNGTVDLVEPEARVEWSLNAIMGDSAFINGRWYKVGENVEGYELKRVEDEQVELVKDGRSVMLFLFKKQKESKQIKINEGLKDGN